MDSERLAQLQELMREARQSGQLEKALVQSSAMPVPSPPSRRNIPLNEYQQMMAALPKQGPVHVSEMALTIPEDVKISPVVSTASTDPRETQGINRMPHEVGT